MGLKKVTWLVTCLIHEYNFYVATLQLVRKYRGQMNELGETKYISHDSRKVFGLIGLMMVNIWIVFKYSYICRGWASAVVLKQAHVQYDIR